MEKKELSLTGTQLKWTALLTMLIDHVALAFFAEGSAPYTAMRLIGRIAFPLFCFLIAEGFHYTKNAYRYGAVMVVFALLSEVPFDMVLFGRFWDMSYQNVFFTLALGIFACLYYERFLLQGRVVMAYASVIVALFVAFFLACDYGPEGVLLIFLLHLFRENEMYRNLLLLIWCMVMGSAEAFGALSILFINLYHGERGKVRFKYAFYAFYPVHLLVIGIIGMFVM